MRYRLTSRERVIRALNHQEPDRVPIDFGGSSNTLIHVQAHESLTAHLGCADPQNRLQSMMTQCVVPDVRLQDMFGADVSLIDPGKPDGWTLRTDPQSDGYRDEWGIRYHRPPGCFYYEYGDHPLKQGTLEEIERYAWPDACDPGRYRGLRERARQLYEGSDKALLVNNPFGIWEHTMALRGFENALVDLAANAMYSETLADRLLEWQETYWDEMLSRIGQFIQVVKINDDLGWSGGPLMSPSTYRRVYKPRHRALVAFIRERTDAKIYMHSDGDIYPFLPDLAEIGIDVLNPVEITARDMDSARLKAEFGDRFSFWGGSCPNNVLALGTPEEVARAVCQHIRDFAPGGGYVLASIHNIQPNVPPENVVALFSTALQWGRYPLADG